MEFLKTKKKDLVPIMKVIVEAQALLASHEIDQWQNGYPNESAILEDLKNNESYIVTSKDSTLIGTAMFTTKNEPTYKSIEGKCRTSRYY